MKILTIFYLGAVLYRPFALSAGLRGILDTPVQAENGKFDIENCTPRQTESVKKALKQGQLSVQKALADIPNGEYSKYGLLAMFKNNHNFAKVQQMLEDLAILKPMPKAMRNLVHQASSPVFVCVSKGHEMVGRSAEEQGAMDIWYERCKPKGHSAKYALTTAYIFLCPRFFRYPVTPEPAKSAILCPVVRKNKYLGDFQELFMFQSYVLLHELVHFYLGDDNLAPETETYRPKNLVALSALDSRRSPRAYECYISFPSAAQL
ncbi:hypothetical protein MMC30_002753 [Trapelia coarctata]|nr:hypothetical protein [Trapelia coarctata]